MRKIFFEKLCVTKGWLSKMYSVEARFYPNTVAKTGQTPCLIYALMHHNHIVYVGQTVDPHTRVKMHDKEKDFEYMASLAVVPLHMSDEIEGNLIHRLHPVLNGVCIGGCTYYVRMREDLKNRKRFEKAYYQELEERCLFEKDVRSLLSLDNLSFSFV